jgi:hypothetical protein
VGERLSRGPQPIGRRRAAWCSVLFFLSFGAAVSIPLHNKPILFCYLSEEWYWFGANLRLFGVVGFGNNPLVLRPPLYPAVVAAALLPLSPEQPLQPGEAEADPALLQGSFGSDGIEMVYFAHAALLAASAALLYLWLSGIVEEHYAVGAGAFLGLNPFSLVLVGNLSYPIAHIFAVVLGGFLLDRAVRDARFRPLLACGVVWGLATLLRPVTLVLPPFVFGALLLRQKWRRAAAGALAFSLGMAATVAPWTLRNALVARTFVPVSAQAGAALWVATLQPWGRDPNHFRWYTAFDSPGLKPILEGVTGKAKYDYFRYVRNVVPLEEAFRKAALVNLRRRPDAYLRNVMSSFVSFNWDIDAVLLDVFDDVQAGGAAGCPPSWLLQVSGTPPLVTSSRRVFEVLFRVLTLLGAAGLLLGLSERRQDLAAPLALYACFAVAHSITWMDLRYYYVKIPCVLVFCAVALDCLERKAAGRLLRPTRIFAAVLLATGLGTSLSLFL